MSNIVQQANISQTIPTFTHTESPTDCGQQIITILDCTPLSGPTCSLANFFTLNGKTISVGTQNEEDVGSYLVTLKVEFASFPEISLILNPFEVNINLCLITAITPSSTLNDVVYYITDPAITRTPSYNTTPSGCSSGLELSVTLSDGSPLPAAITYNATTISVQTNDYSAVNVYTVKVVATDP